MPVNATSPKSRSVHGLKDLIAQSVDFREGVGAADETAARNWIFITRETADELGNYQEPGGAVIFWPRSMRGVHRTSAVFEVEFVLSKDVPKEYRGESSQDHEDALTDFENWADSIIEFLRQRMDPIGSVPVDTIIGAGIDQVSDTSRSRVSATNEDRIYARYKAVIGQSRRS